MIVCSYICQKIGIINQNLEIFNLNHSSDDGWRLDGVVASISEFGGSTTVQATIIN